LPASKKSNKYANYGRHQETDSPAAQVVLQDMLQVRGQEPDLCHKVQEVPQQPDEAKEQDAGSQEVIIFSPAPFSNLT
jgi:hypothetical protein